MLLIRLRIDVILWFSLIQLRTISAVCSVQCQVEVVVMHLQVAARKIVSLLIIKWSLVARQLVLWTCAIAMHCCLSCLHTDWLTVTRPDILLAAFVAGRLKINCFVSVLQVLYSMESLFVLNVQCYWVTRRGVSTATRYVAVVTNGWPNHCVGLWLFSTSEQCVVFHRLPYIVYCCQCD